MAITAAAVAAFVDEMRVRRRAAMPVTGFFREPEDEGPIDPALSGDALEARVAAVREAKLAKRTRGDGGRLTNRELAIALPEPDPKWVARTKLRYIR